MKHWLYCWLCPLFLFASSCTTRIDENLLTVIADPHSNEEAAKQAMNSLGSAKESPLFWAAIANNNIYTIERRRNCVMQLFRRHVHDGMTLEETAKCLQKTSWLSCDLLRVLGAYTGYLPIHDGLGGEVVEIVVFPYPEKDSQHISEVYLSLSDSLPAGDVCKVLRGEPVDFHGERIKLKEIGFYER